MYLKQYQQRVVNELNRFFQVARKNKENIQSDPSTNYVQSTLKELGLAYKDAPINGLQNYYPRMAIKVPTGGGKTLLAIEAIREYQHQFLQKRNGLIVWVVPSETIYSQTVDRLRTKNHPYRQLLDQASGGRTLILEKGQKLIARDLQENLVVLFVMVQAVSRKNNKEALKVFRDSGGFESFFPPDHRTDLHKSLLERIPNLDVFSDHPTAHSQIKTSMGNAVRISNPFIIIDEMHKVFTPTAKKTIDNLNPKMVLGLTATPRPAMNILSSVSGPELKKEEMVKLDMHIFPPANNRKNDWKSMIRKIKLHREKLEKKAQTIEQQQGRYIRPLTLIQVERTGSEQQTGEHVHSLDVKTFLEEKLHIPGNQIGIKSSTQNDIEDLNLLSRDCPIRYLITRDALREGWDCPFAYILGIIPNVNSNTGITQLTGRILRQPHVTKTGSPSLDESYIYYTKGTVGKLLENVKQSFRQEGMEHLASHTQVHSPKASQRAQARLPKKPDISHHETELFPIWLMIEEQGKLRKFTYQTDIRPELAYESLNPDNQTLKHIHNTLNNTQADPTPFTLLNGDGATKNKRPQFSKNQPSENIDLDYMTSRFSEIIDNPFLARKKAREWMAIITEDLDQNQIASNFSVVVTQLTIYLAQERKRMEQDTFLNYLDNDKLHLAISHYKLPNNKTVLQNASSAEGTRYSTPLPLDTILPGEAKPDNQANHFDTPKELLQWWFKNNFTAQGQHLPERAIIKTPPLLYAKPTATPGTIALYSGNDSKLLFNKVTNRIFSEIFLDLIS